ncbi:MAG: PL29 family lyase N-terminal domain-containing protein [Bacteroidales bacterium]|nr:PL29 family lyase N-terminal domain-containing protein [Bacteroidales bacterium]MDD3201420.1 PL29 family lyase N-terminal domain-containing protein [Bacteroidales bacterium]
MKRLYLILFIFVSVFVLSGCHKDLNTKISDLRDKVSALETRVSELNASLSALQSAVSALESNDHISSIEPVISNGDTTGYKIIFTSGTVINLPNGTNGTTPFLGIQQDYTTGYYYWTIQMGNNTPTWMTNSYGLKIRATGIVPQMKIEDGYWMVSYDGGTSWSKLFEASGEEGTSVFKKIDYSDPYFVIFTLVDDTEIKIPTMKGIMELSAKCDTINSNIRAYKSIINNIDSSLFITSVSEVMENTAIVGYRFTFANGDTLTLRNGEDNTDPVYISTEYDMALSASFWTIKFKESDPFTWLYNNGERVSADPVNGTPIIGVKDTLGVYYFTVKIGDDISWMLDGEGNKVQATNRYGFRFFSGVSIGSTSVIFTLANGSQVELPRGGQKILSLILSDPKANDPSAAVMTLNGEVYEPGVDIDSSYLFTATIQDTVTSVSPPSVTEALASSSVSISAIGVEGGAVTSVVLNSAGYTLSAVGSSFAVSIPYTIKFSTGSVLNAAQTTKIAVFITWNTRTVMKVIEFKNN